MRPSLAPTVASHVPAILAFRPGTPAEKSRAASTEPPPQTEEADETTPLVSGGKPARKSRFSLLKRQNSSVAADIAVNEVLEHERQHPEEPHPVHVSLWPLRAPSRR